MHTQYTHILVPYLQAQTRAHRLAAARDSHALYHQSIVAGYSLHFPQALSFSGDERKEILEIKDNIEKRRK